MEEVRDFAKEFDPELRIQKFGGVTQQYSPDSATETKPPVIDDFDREYIKSVYAFAKNLQDSDANIEDFYKLLQQTLFRRGKHFVASVGVRGLQVEPKRPEVDSFADIVGYSEQTAYLKTLLRRTAENHRSINNVRLVLLASKPGLGKTFSITAFFNELPENARGVIFDHKAATRRRVVSAVLEEFAKLANLHPDLHIFAGIEDINTNDYLEDELLDVESIIPGNFPTNLHLIATTNYLEVMPPALLRPGRTSEILFFRATKKSSERAGIVRLHAKKQEVVLSPRSVNTIANRTSGFTPDELAHIVRTVSLECSEDPTKSEIDRIITKIKERRDIAKMLRNSG